MTEWGELKDMPDMEHSPRPKKGPNCFHCIYFRTTWDVANPRGCALFEFKCSEMPSAEVRRTTGNECIAFKRKS